MTGRCLFRGRRARLPFLLCYRIRAISGRCLFRGRVVEIGGQDFCYATVFRRCQVTAYPEVVVLSGHFCYATALSSVASIQMMEKIALLKFCFQSSLRCGMASCICFVIRWFCRGTYVQVITDGRGRPKSPFCVMSWAERPTYNNLNRLLFEALVFSACGLRGPHTPTWTGCFCFHFVSSFGW